MAMPVASYVTRVREEFQWHIDEGGCPFVDQSPIASLYHEGAGRGMSTFHDAFLDARRRIESGADPEEVVPVLLRLAEAADEYRPRAGTMMTTTPRTRTSDGDRRHRHRDADRERP